MALKQIEFLLQRVGGAEQRRLYTADGPLLVVAGKSIHPDAWVLVGGQPIRPVNMFEFAVFVPAGSVLSVARLMTAKPGPADTYYPPGVTTVLNWREPAEAAIEALL